MARESVRIDYEAASIIYLLRTMNRMKLAQEWIHSYGSIDGNNMAIIWKEIAMKALKWIIIIIFD